jgi:formate hydrogenlyase subunit 3/multisubunit Na+/H+ antiporter MnhD subunit
VTPQLLLGLAVALVGGSGVLALLTARRPDASTAIAAGGAALGGALGLAGALWALHDGLAWRVPAGAALVGVDPLTSFFLVPLCVIGGLAAVYGRAYLAGHGARARALAAVALNLLLVSMALVLIARHAMVFLVAWEAMTLLAYLLVTVEHDQAEVRRAGWAYLIASHVAMLALVALFLTMGARAGGALDFAAMADAPRAGAAGAALLAAIALLGFGVKAGVVGLHVWLPEAHAAAPSHVSALMSAVLIKLGVYGLLRMSFLLAPPATAGLVLAVIGLLGALVGISLAAYQRDLKRVLAYSSVENVGIVLLGVGVGLWARGHGDGRLASLAFAGALLHVWNHAAMKGLMFMGAGSVLHGAGTKDMERLGGLARRMPVTSAAMIAGAVAIAALPPLNGLTGEWLVYRALVDVGLRADAASGLAAIAAVAGLALVGALAALCFVRLVGVTLLGQARSDGAAHAHESPRAMTAPMWLLLIACAAAALAPGAVVTGAQPAIGMLAGGDGASVHVAVGVLAPLATLNLALWIALALVGYALARRVREPAADATWGCGYAAPTARMQYGARGLSETLTSRVMPRWLRPRPVVSAPEGLFPKNASLDANTADPLTRGGYEPMLERAGDRFARLRFLQRGSLHLYLAYIVAVTVLGLAWVGVRDWWTP